MGGTLAPKITYFSSTHDFIPVITENASLALGDFLQSKKFLLSKDFSHATKGANFLRLLILSSCSFRVLYALRLHIRSYCLLILSLESD